jgi:hypothetical protein
MGPGLLYIPTEDHTHKFPQKDYLTQSQSPTRDVLPEGCLDYRLERFYVQNMQGQVG